MKKAFKRTTAAIMAAMILATTATTVTVFATETTGTTENGNPSTGAGATVSAEINSEDTLKTAIKNAAASTVTEITLAGDIENVSDYLRITDGKNIKLNLNGYNITFAQNKYFLVKNGTLELEGKGTVKESSPNYSPVLMKGSDSDVANFSNVIVGKDVTLEGWAGLFMDQTTNANNYGMTAEIHGALKGCKDTSGAMGAGIYVNGIIAHETGNAPKIHVYDGAIINAEGLGMYLAGFTNTTIDKATVTGSETGIEIRAGKLTVNGATITGNGYPTSVTPNGNGATSDGAGIAVEQHTTKLVTEVTVNSGTINGYTAIYESNPQKNSEDDIAKVKLDVQSGTFNAINGGSVSVYSQDKKGFITGGIFVTSTSVGEYTATGYEAAGVYDKSGNPAYLVGEDGITTSGTATNPTARITGGTFNFDPSDYVESGYVASQSNGKYVVSKYVAPAAPSTPADTSKTETTTDPSTGTTTTTTTTTKPDGTTTEEKIETTTDGTKTETKTETKADGSSTSSSTVTDATGNVVEKSETKVEVKEDKSTTETTTTTKPQEETKVETTVEKDAKGEVTKETTTTSSTNAEDLSKVIVEKENTENSKGADVAQTTTTVINSAGATESVTEEQVIENIGNRTDAVVTVEKNGSGEVQNAEAVVEKTGATKGAAVQATITNKVVSQIVEAAGEDAADVMSITINVTDEQGNDKYTVTVDKEALEPGANLTIYKKNKDGELVMVNDRDYKVSENGNVKLVIKSSNDFVLLSEEQNKAEEARIKATIAAKNSKKTIKKNRTTTMALQNTLDMANVQKIDYKSSKPGVAHINANGKIRGKKSGTVTIKAIITLKNGSKKTVTMKLTVA